MAAPAQRDFRLGEVAPSFYGRADLGLYASGLRTLRNAYVKRMGGITSRPGTLYKGTTKGSGAVVLVDAVFDDTENYVLEFGNLYVRVWKNGALVTVGTPASWATATAYTAGAVRSNGGTNYVCILGHTSGSSTEPGVGASWQTNWYALTGAIYEYPTDYTTAQLSALQFAAQYRVVTIVHPSHPPATMTFDANGLAVLADIDFTEDASVPTGLAVSGSSGSGWGYALAAVYPASDPRGPIGPATGFIRTNTVTLPFISQYRTARAVDPRTVTWNAVDGATSYLLYVQFADGGDIYSIPVTGTSYVDSGSAWPSYPTSTYASNDAVSAPVFAAAGEYPSAVGAFQQRLLFGGADNTPDVVAASRVASPDTFFASDPIVNSDALSWRQVGQRLNRVRFFAEAAKRLWQFSSVAEAEIQGDVDGILRPGEVNPRVVSQHGISPNVPPLVAGDAVLYVQARGNQVQDIWPDGSGSEISRTAWHLLDGYEVVSWCFQRAPDRVVWAVRDDGKLLSLTYNREDQVLGWALHDTDGSFERVVCVPEGDEDAVYVVVNRTINSSTVRYVERLADRQADTPIVGMDAVVQGQPGGQTASIARTTLGRQAAYSSTAETDVTTSFVIGDWAEDGAGSLSVTVGNQLLYINSGSDGNVPIREVASNGVADDCYVQTVLATSTNGTVLAAGAGARMDSGTVTSADFVRMQGGNFGTGSFGLSETVAGSAVQTDVSTEDAWTLPARTALWVRSTLADGHDFNTGESYSLTGLTANGAFAGWVKIGGAAGATRGISFYARTLSAELTVANAPAGWTAEVLDASDNILASGTSDGSDITVNMLTVVLPNARKLRVKNASGVALFTEEPDEAVWPGDTWTLTFTPNPSNVFAGLEPLEGEAVSVVADGTVIASPYNAAYDPITVTGGQVTLDDTYTTVYVGLPVVTDIQTLDIETVNGTRKDAGILVNRIGLWLEDTLGLSARATEPSSSTSLDGFQSLPVVDEDGNTTTTPVTGYREVTVDGVWTRGGRIFLRNVDPTPVTIHSIAVQGQFGRS